MIRISVAHDLPQEEAVRRVHGLLGDVKKKYGHHISGLREKWEGDTGTFRFSVVGLLVSGTITVGDAVVKVVSRKLPFPVHVFKERIEDRIFAEAKRILS